jgi:tRNA pseudouridine55 synthase
MDGLLIVDKPQGWTSHDVVARSRRLLREKRIGHAGTLDPMATGVLILCIGQATRLSEYLLGEDKAYEGVIALGARTNTDDAEGEVVEIRPVPGIDDATLRALERRFSGDIRQVPPQFSAIQKGGRRAYALARAGERVELEARRVVVHELVLTRERRAEGVQPSLLGPRPTATATLALHVTCSSGAYVRALARDIGEALGCGGHLVALRRTRSGMFGLDAAVTMERLAQAAEQGQAPALLLPMDRAVAGWPAVTLDDAAARRVRNGRTLVLTADLAPRETGLVRVYDGDRNLIAIARWDGVSLAPMKVFDAASSFIR